MGGKRTIQAKKPPFLKVHAKSGFSLFKENANVLSRCEITKKVNDGIIFSPTIFFGTMWF